MATQSIKNQVLPIFRTRIEELYNEAHSLLLEQESYEKTVDTQNVSLYFTFLESSLKKPYNRLIALSTYLHPDNIFLTGQAYPFALLKDEIKERINKKHTEAYRLAESLDVSGIDPNYESLDIEEFMKVST